MSLLEIAAAAVTMLAAVAASPERGELGPRDVSARVAEAKALLSENRRLEAARLVSPCLELERATVGDALEDCLFVGEEIAVAVVSNLALRSDLDAMRQEEKALGVEFEYGEYEVTYGHEYFERLRVQFPRSRHSDLYAYVLALANQPLAWNWRNAEAALEQYLSAFPAGRYAVRARLDLAHIYDNVWELMRPDTRYASYREEVTEEAGGDATLAEDYRKKALELYSEVIASPESKRLGISEYDYDEAVERRSELTRGQTGNQLWIISD